jgi:hypothetical protein
LIVIYGPCHLLGEVVALLFTRKKILLFACDTERDLGYAHKAARSY